MMMQIYGIALHADLVLHEGRNQGHQHRDEGPPPDTTQKRHSPSPARAELVAGMLDGEVAEPGGVPLTLVCQDSPPPMQVSCIGGGDDEHLLWPRRNAFLSQNRSATHTMSFSSAVTISPTIMVAKTSVIQSCKDRGGAHDR